MNKKNIEVLILAGGHGTRLASVVNDVPKPMAPVKGKPFLEHLINFIKNQGFKNFRLLTGFKSDIIQNHFRDGSHLGIDIKYTTENSPLGTGGALKLAIRDSKFKKFLVFNGDSFFDVDLTLFLDKVPGDFSIALKYFQNCERYGQVVVDNNFIIKSFVEKGDNPNNGFINAGIYFFSKKILNYFINEESFSIEKEIMPKLSRSGLLTGIPLEGNFIDIGTPEDYIKVQNYF